MKLLHEWSKRVVFDCRAQRNTRVHRNIPNGSPETKAIDQIYGHCLVDGIDWQDFVVYVAIVHVPIGEVDLAGVHTEGHDGSVVNHASGIYDLHKGTIICIANGAGLKGRGRKFRSGRSGNDT